MLYILSLLDAVILRLLYFDNGVQSVISSGIFSCRSYLDILIDYFSYLLFAPSMIILKAKIAVKVEKGSLRLLVIWKSPLMICLRGHIIMCRRNEETIDPLFLHCYITLLSLTQVISSLEIGWSCHFHVFWYLRLGMSKKTQTILGMWSIGNVLEDYGWKVGKEFLKRILKIIFLYYEK